MVLLHWQSSRPSPVQNRAPPTIPECIEPYYFIDTILHRVAQYMTWSWEACLVSWLVWCQSLIWCASPDRQVRANEVSSTQILPNSSQMLWYMDQCRRVQRWWQS